MTLLVVVVVALWKPLGLSSWGEVPMGILRAMRGDDVAAASRLAIHGLILRLQHGREVIEPAPGVTSRSMVFRDVLGHSVRLRCVPEQRRLVAEVRRNGTWVNATTDPDEPEVLQGGQVPACESAFFTTLTPASVCVGITTSDGSVRESTMAVIALANGGLDA